MVAARDQSGKWLPGASANPSGRPADPMRFREQLRDLTPAAIKRLGKQIDGEDEQVAHAACRYVLDQGWGKAFQAVGIVTKSDAGPDLSHFTDDELRQLRELTGRAEERARLAQAQASDSVVEGKLIEGSK